MTEYIERDKVMDVLLHEQYGYLCEDAINSIPAADVRSVVKGTWRERRFSEDVYGAQCSVCHTTWDYGTNYCPNCGADMRSSYE